MSDPNSEWSSNMLYFSDTSDDEADAPPSVPRTSPKAVTLPSSETSSPFADDETAYYAADDLLDIGAIEEFSTTFRETPFTIAKAAASARTRKVDQVETVLPPRTLKVPAQSQGNNPLFKGFERQREKAAKSALKPLSQKKKKKEQKKSPKSPLQARPPTALDIVTDQNSPVMVIDTSDDHLAIEQASMASESPQMVVHHDAISLLPAFTSHSHGPAAVIKRPQAVPDHNGVVLNTIQTVNHIQLEPKMSKKEPEPFMSSEAFYPTVMLSTPRKKLAGPAPAYSNQSPSTPIKKRTALPNAQGSNEEDFSTLSIQIPPKNRYINTESNSFITSIRPAMQSFTLPGISTDLLRNNPDRKLFKPPTSYRSFKRTLQPEEEEDQQSAKRFQVRSAARPSPFRPLEMFTSKDSEVLSTEDHLEEEVYKDDAHRMRQAMARYESPSSERKGGAASKAKGSVFRFDDF